MPFDTISQLSIFDYMPNEDVGDLVRLRLCLDELNYQGLIDKLDQLRGHGRNDFPNATMFKILIAQFLFKRLDISDMRRELSMNRDMREMVGLHDGKMKSMGKTSMVPSDDAFTNFYANLAAHPKWLDDVFVDARNRLFNLVPDYGIECAGDGKYFDSYAPNRSKDGAKPGKRGEHDAKYSIKESFTTTASGERKTKKETHYGFRKHTIVDVRTQLPIASVLLSAEKDEKKAMSEHVLPSIPKEIIKRVRYMSFDRGYDSKDYLDEVRSYGIKPIIDKRIMGKKNRLLQYNDCIYYNEYADLFFREVGGEETINPETGLPACYKRMKFVHYDRTKGSKDENGLRRGALIYEYNGRHYSIDINRDPRFFTEVARDSQKFKRLYAHRTSVERYHAIQDTCFGFEVHTIRGLDKMSMLVQIGDIVMLGLALAHVKRGDKHLSSMYDFDLV